MKFAVGVDLGGTAIKFGLFQTDGDLIYETSRPTGAERPYEQILIDIVNQIKHMLDENHIHESDLVGIGVGIPGPVTDESKVNHCVNLGWEEVDVGHYIKKHFDCRVKVGNDANVAALGEIRAGAAKGYRSMVLITLGTGIGGGIVIDGKILAGNHGAGGEVGHIPFLKTPLDRICGCGGQRCFEQICSAPNIVTRTKELLASSDEDSVLRKDLDKLDTEIIYKAAARGDKLAIEITDETANEMGRALAIIGAVVDPEVFVIGGGVSAAGDGLFKPLRNYYEKYCFREGKNVPIVLASLGNKAGIYGAAGLVLEEDSQL